MNDAVSPLRQLVERCRGDDEAAWALFHACFQRIAARVLSRFTNLAPLEREEAEDSARVSVALEIRGGRVKAATDGAVVGFVRIVVTNAARDVWRRRRPFEPLPVLLCDEAPSPAERARHRADLECAEQVMKSWSAANRLVFAMKLEQVSAVTIRAELERLFGVALTVDAIDVRYSRMRAELRRRCGMGGAGD